MIGSRIRPRPGCAPKISAAIGAPAARDFLLAQNTAATSSAGLKRRARAVRVVIQRISASNSALPINAVINTALPCCCHMPETIELQKAA
ncbi:hypothetical protein D9M71_735060 [compost metagenome]